MTRLPRVRLRRWELRTKGGRGEFSLVLLKVIFLFSPLRGLLGIILFLGGS